MWGLELCMLQKKVCIELKQRDNEERYKEKKLSDIVYNHHQKQLPSFYILPTK